MFSPLSVCWLVAHVRTRWILQIRTKGWIQECFYLLISIINIETFGIYLGFFFREFVYCGACWRCALYRETLPVVLVSRWMFVSISGQRVLCFVFLHLLRLSRRARGHVLSSLYCRLCFECDSASGGRRGVATFFSLLLWLFSMVPRSSVSSHISNAVT